MKRGFLSSPRLACRARWTRTPSGTVLRLLMRTLRNLRFAGLTEDFR